MAIQAAYNSDVGILIPEAYLTVMSFSGDRYLINFTVGIYANKAAYDLGRPPVEQHFYSMPFSGNMLDILYTYMLTLPEFTGSIDVG